MAATYEGSSGPGGASVAPTVTSGNHARLCSVSLVKQRQSGMFNMTSAVVPLKAREGTFHVRIQVFPAFLENESENAPVKSLNAVGLAGLTSAPLISYSADAVC